MIEEIIQKVSRRENLTSDEMESAMRSIALGNVVEAKIASFLTALAAKGETADEITGAARAMRKFVTPVKIKADVIFDTCGTGGDGKGTFNISTVCAFVVAGGGITVAKHGNRSVSGTCGSADLLEAIGVNIEAPVQIVEKCMAEIGIGFLFAPRLHPAMQFVQSVRKDLKMRTIFNVLGPLINPANPTHQLLGVYDKELVFILGTVLKNIGIKHAMVVWGEGGFDEVTTTGKTYVCEVSTGLKEYVLEPEKFGIPKADKKDFIGGSVEANKQIALRVLRGLDGPERDVVLLNAGCSFYIAGKVSSIKDGVEAARVSIDSGAAIKKLNKLIEYTKAEV